MQNKISKIEGLEDLTVLRNLELGANKIRVGLYAPDIVEGLLMVGVRRRLRIWRP